VRRRAPRRRGHPDQEPPDTAEVAFLEAIADQTAVAIENARLFEQAQYAAVGEERQRLSRELHDSVSQALYGISLGAQTARGLLARDATKAGEAVDYVLSLAEAGMAEMRALIFELRPDALAAEGLVSALAKQAASTRTRHAMTVELEFGEEPDIPLAWKETLYRITQEALHNIVKHANASAVQLALHLQEKQLVLTVADNGRGFEVADDYPGHLGLKSMRERARRYGGDAEIESAPGAGCTIRVTLPLLG
jgi:signal transduction histidine kinase